MIDVQHVTKRYGSLTAIQDITFSVAKGEIVAFLGPNGAGKTTTMRILTGYMPPTSGSVHVAGYDCQESPLETKQRMGYFPEHPPLYLELTVNEYLTFVGRLKGVTLEQLPHRMDQVIEQTGLGNVRQRVIGHLSRGYRQRVGLAQALIHDPPVLILDEPTVGLDPNQIIEIRELIKSLAGSHTIILSTHILPEATALCERMIIIHQGHIVAIDTQEQLAARLRRSEQLRITVKTPLPDMESQLTTVPGVVNVSTSDVENTYIVEAELGHDIREAVTNFVMKHELGLLELSVISMSLEDVFIRLTNEEEPVEETAP
ncbi:MAG: ATP-binding cassette domain-containing protein [Nitrospirales bacterium]|nr:ATP-binding cassette domain-containing protein [Nitrospira sp.]MDR4499869.1 ATP-binding cassette domain-containing protein [Nitrospirales bacterium]